VSYEDYRNDPDLQWIVERGLLNAASLVFDIADHVLSGHFGGHGDTYQASLDGLHEEHVIQRDLHEELEGLGGFRHLLVHEYIELDSGEVHQHFQSAFEVFPRFASAVLAWLEEVDGS
jgi:uncharacterized protein YutE (UPF0331/DUF86 family)